MNTLPAWSGFFINPAHSRHWVLRNKVIEQISRSFAGLRGCLMIAKLEVNPRHEVLIRVVELFDECVTELEHLLFYLSLVLPTYVFHLVLH